MDNEKFQELVLDNFKEISKKFKKVESIETKIDNITAQLDENTQLLKALEHKADVNKAEHDKMFIDIAKISGKVEELRNDMSTVEVIAAKNNLDIAKLKAVK